MENFDRPISSGEAPAHCDPVSSQVVKLVLDFGGGKYWAVGAGFMLSGPSGPFMATAFHNFSGGLSPAARFQGRQPPRPLQVELVFEGRTVARFAPYEKGRSLFRVHPHAQICGNCDVAVVDYDDLRAHAAEDGADSRFWELPGINAYGNGNCRGYRQVSDMYLSAGHDVIVFGYPGGRDFREGPIGVGCKIAAQAGQAEPCLLLSGHTSTGCSGAPAVARGFGGYIAMDEGGLVRKERDAPITDQWLGLYSGRLESVGSGLGAKKTQIGVVWSSHTVMEVAEHGMRDNLR